PMPRSSNPHPAAWVRPGARADRVPAGDDLARPGLAASGVNGLEELLEDLLSTQTQDRGA
ncbi:MAG: hypothetical protein ACRECP_03415, partial [Methylocella sp.]